MYTISRMVTAFGMGLLFLGCSSSTNYRDVNASQAPASLATAAPSATPVNFTVKGTVPKIKQPTDNTCWAASATMMQSWKDNITYKILDVMDKAGADFKQKFQSDDGLSGTEKPFFLKALALKAEPPRNYTAAGWLDLLQKHGPLWVTTNEGTTQDFAIHARILRGISGDGTPDATFLTFIDPATGAEIGESVTVFTKKFEEIAVGDHGAGAEIRPQVVHF